MAENNIYWWDGTEESARKAYEGHPKMAEAFGSFENYLDYLNAYSDLIASVRDEAGELLNNSAEYQAVVDAGGLLQYAGQMVASGEEFAGVDYLTDIQNLWKEQQDALLEQYAPGFSFDTFEESDGDKWSWNGSQWVRYEQGSDAGWDVFSDVLSAAGFAFIGSGLGGALGGGLTGSGAAGLEAALPTLGATTGSTVGAGAGSSLGLFAPTSGSGAGPAVNPYSTSINDPSQFTQMLVDMFGPGIGGTGSLQNWQDFAQGILTGNLDLIKNSISVLVPSIPTGLPLPPSMMVLGTIGAILEYPGALVTSKINQLLNTFVIRDPLTGEITGIQSPEDLLGSLGGFIQGAYEDMPPDQIPPIILAGILANEYGQDVYDWLKDQFGYGDESVESFEEFLQDNNILPFSGEEEDSETLEESAEPPEETESFDRVEQTESLLGDMTAAFGDTTAEEDPLVNVEDPDKYGFPGAETAEDDIVGDDQETETTFDGVEQTENTLSDLISGFESNDSDLTFGGGTRQEEIGSDPTVSQEPEDTLSGSSGGGAGGGGGGASKPYEFMARLNYLRPEMVPIISQGQVDFNSSMFNKPQQKRKGLQLGSITESLFERFI